MKVKLQNHFLRVLEFCKSAMSKCLIIPFNSAFFGEVKKSPTYNNAHTSFICSRDVNHLFYSVPIEGWCVTHALWVVCLCLSIAAAAVPASNLASSARPCFLEMSCLCNYYYYHQRRPFIGCPTVKVQRERESGKASCHLLGVSSRKRKHGFIVWLGNATINATRVNEVLLWKLREW